MGKLIDMAGKSFGRLKVLSFAHSNKGLAHWNCVCSCGTVKVISGAGLRKGTKSCGCIVRDVMSAIKTTHGETKQGKPKPKEYKIWTHIKCRCYYEKDKDYKYYGARGITVCDRWRNSYENFIADMGRIPSEHHSIDRINNNGNYTSENCRWATTEEQNRNKRRKGTALLSV